MAGPIWTGFRPDVQARLSCRDLQLGGTLHAPDPGGEVALSVATVRAYARSHQGLVRSDNQDAFLVRSFPDGVLAVVADGMGGAPGGREASQHAIQVLDRAVTQHPQSVVELERIVKRANRELYAWARSEPRLLGMGTTLTLVQVHGEEVAVVHVGDSRAYMLREGHLERLTRDHAVAAELQASGLLTEAEALMHPQRHVVTRVLGPGSTVRLDLIVVPRHPGERILLCSDGLYDVLNDTAIAEILSTHRGDDAVDELVERALQAGGPDNVTVILVEEDEASDGR